MGQQAQQVLTTSSVLRIPELGIFRLPLQTHVPPSAASCSMSHEAAAWEASAGCLVRAR